MTENSECMYSSEEELGVEISCHSSDFEEDDIVEGSNTDDHRRTLGVQPYNFEPYLSDASESEEIPTEEHAVQRDQRVGNTDWCTCHHCGISATERESLCCHEIPEIFLKIQDRNICCITEHPSFEAVYLNEDTLFTAYLGFNQHYGVQLQDRPERYRYTGYRQLVRWMWGRLGREIRVVIPACAVKAIRNRYPCPEGSYTGFLAPPN